MENKKIMGVLAGGVVLGAVLGAGAVYTALKSKLPSDSKSPMQCSAGENSNGMFFSFKGKDYAKQDLPQDLRTSIYDVERNTYDQVNNMLKEYALRIELAERKGIKLEKDKPVPSIPEILSLKEPDNAEIDKFLKDRSIKLPPSVTMEQVRPQVVQAIMQQKSQDAVAPFRDTLNTFKLLAPAPEAPVVNFNLQGYLFKGSDKAQVEVVMAYDYLCPHCRTVKPQVDAAVVEFKDKIKFVPIIFPISNEGINVYLARGAWCAGQQSSEGFWKYNDEAFNVSPEAQRSVAPNKDKEFMGIVSGVANKAGLEAKKFSNCMESSDAKEFVQNTVKMMQDAGVRGTPTIFINKRRIDGNAPIGEVIKQYLK